MNGTLKMTEMVTFILCVFYHHFFNSKTRQWEGKTTFVRQNPHMGLPLTV
jgi:hypothetical protein